jgi:hypothetical protein
MTCVALVWTGTTHICMPWVPEGGLAFERFTLSISSISTFCFQHGTSFCMPNLPGFRNDIVGMRLESDNSILAKDMMLRIPGGLR